MKAEKQSLNVPKLKYKEICQITHSINMDKNIKCRQSEELTNEHIYAECFTNSCSEYHNFHDVTICLS